MDMQWKISSAFIELETHMIKVYLLIQFFPFFLRNNNAKIIGLFFVPQSLLEFPICIHSG